MLESSWNHLPAHPPVHGKTVFHKTSPWSQKGWGPPIYLISAAAAAESLQSCPTLCDPIDGSPSGTPIPGILQARTLEWVAMSFSQCMKVKSESEVTQSCPTLSDAMDCSLPGSSVHGIFQARVLEWGAIAFSILNFYCCSIQNIPYIKIYESCKEARKYYPCSKEEIVNWIILRWPR